MLAMSKKEFFPPHPSINPTIYAYRLVVGYNSRNPKIL